MTRDLRFLLWRAWMAVVFPISWLVSQLLLASAFVLVLTPIGLVLRLVGRDPLQRRFDRDASSYWIARRTGRKPGEYFRQF